MKNKIMNRDTTPPEERNVSCSGLSSSDMVVKANALPQSQ